MDHYDVEAMIRDAPAIRQLERQVDDVENQVRELQRGLAAMGETIASLDRTLQSRTEHLA